MPIYWALPEADRLKLAYVLLDSVEQPVSDGETDDDTEKVVGRRRADVLSGVSALVPGEEALRQVREALASEFEHET